MLILPLGAFGNGVIQLGLVRVTLRLRRVSLPRIWQVKLLLNHLLGFLVTSLHDDGGAWSINTRSNRFAQTRHKGVPL